MFVVIFTIFFSDSDLAYSLEISLIEKYSKRDEIIGKNLLRRFDYT